MGKSMPIYGRQNVLQRIDPLTGQVVGWIDLKGILSLKDDSGTVDVLIGCL